MKARTLALGNVTLTQRMFIYCLLLVTMRHSKYPEANGLFSSLKKFIMYWSVFFDVLTLISKSFQKSMGTIKIGLLCVSNKFSNNLVFHLISFIN